MITQKNIDNLYRIASNLSLKDYRAANPTSNGKPVYRTHKPYGLSGETKEATELLKMASKSEVTREEEETIKGYLLKIRRVLPDLMNDNASYLQWKRVTIK